MRRGCHPAGSLAKAVIAAQACAAAPPPAEPKPARPRRPRPYNAVDAAMGRAASGLPAILGLEAAYAHLPELKAAEPSEAPAASEPATTPNENLVRPRRPNPLTARLRAGTAPHPADAADSHPRGLLRTWAQGP
jgi:hypothetical protein